LTGTPSDLDYPRRGDRQGVILNRPLDVFQLNPTRENEQGWRVPVPRREISRMSHEKPFVHNLVLCDMVWRDRATGKFFMLGAFNQVFSEKFPAQHPSMAIYLALSHWVSEQDLVIQLAKDSVNILAKLPPIRIPRQEPRKTVQIALNLPPLSLPDAGEYSLQVVAGGQLIHEFPFDVVLRKG
jgi:hypothetical protein